MFGLPRNMGIHLQFPLHLQILKEILIEFLLKSFLFLLFKIEAQPCPIYHILPLQFHQISLLLNPTLFLQLFLLVNISQIPLLLIFHLFHEFHRLWHSKRRYLTVSPNSTIFVMFFVSSFERSLSIFLIFFFSEIAFSYSCLSDSLQRNLNRFSFSFRVSWNS